MEVIFVLSAFLVFCSVVAACILVGAIARSRGRSFFAWTIVSLLLSPLLSIFALLIMRQRTDVLERRRMRAGDLQYCPYCSEPIRKKALACRFCKRDLTATATPIAYLD